jgi:hypothetical protein
MADKSPAIAYLGDLMGGGIMLRESKVLADMLQTNPSPEEWRHLVDKENILQKRSIHTARRVALAVKHRLQPLGESFWQDLIQADTETSKQLILFAVLLRSKALLEFMRTVISDARRLYQEELHISSWHFLRGESRNYKSLLSYRL